MPKRKRTSSIDQPKAPRAAEPRAFSQYTALNKDKQEIRVVTLHAGADGDPINCTIENTLLTEAQPFTALSYCWSSAEDLKEITLNGETITIRRNLWHFLESLRHLKGPIRIWVDYICINQQDVKERGHQVQLMADIYKTARAVYAWLGAASLHTDVAMEFATKLRVACYEWRKSPEALRMRRVGSVGYQSLAARVFWSRLWIIQEVVLARHLCVFVGRTMVNWSWITGAFEDVVWDGPSPDYVPDLDEDLELLANDYERKVIFQHIRALRETQAEGSYPDVRSLLNRFWKCQCHDPRDRVYSMLGLLDAHIRSQFSVDYSQTLIELVVLNSRLLGPRSRIAKQLAMQYPTLEIYDSSIFGFVARICGDGGLSVEVSRWMKDQALRRRHGLSLVLDARLWTACQSFQTFAARKTADCDWEPFTTYNQSQNFAIYMTHIGLETSAGARPLDYKPKFKLSTLRPEPGDLFLHLQPYYCLARRVQGSLRVLDIAAVVDNYADKYSHYVSDYDWLKGRVPDIQLHLEQSPFMLEDPDFDPSFDRSSPTLRWPVRVNGSALAEGIRIFVATRHEHYSTKIRVHVTLPWDPKLFVRRQEGGDSEPTEAQFDETSRQMRLPANIRLASLSTDSTCKRWDLFELFRPGYGQRANFHQCIPRFRTNPLTVPEIAAVPKVIDATERYESLIDKSNQRMQQGMRNMVRPFNNTDLLTNSDFDSSSNTTTDDASDSDSGMIGGSFSVDDGNYCE